MGKSLFIAEKPSVAKEFAKALKVSGSGSNGYIESNEYVITWCVGHLITMSYPECYDSSLKKWKLETLPFLPKEYKYEVIPAVSKQFELVKKLLTREDVEVIYVCTDSGREGEYIYRLVEQAAGVVGKERRRVWIDSQTEEEILKGIKTAKDLAEYDNLSASAYLRAKEDYLMGINFSRVLTLKYGNSISNYLGMKYAVISVGRVMTCVLGMVVKREREIRDFVKMPFYRVLDTALVDEENNVKISLEWRVTEDSKYYQSPYLYKENGFKEEKYAKELIESLNVNPIGEVIKIERKKEKKNPPLLFNLAELQNECSKLLKISPDETLKVVQTLYERKLVTYPRTDARVLSSAISKEIHKNIKGLLRFEPVSRFAAEIMEKGSYKNLVKTRYVNDKQITDHYAIIPTGQGIEGLKSLRPEMVKVYELIVRRFVSIFYPPAVYQKVSIEVLFEKEHFFTSSKVLESEGYLEIINGTSGSDNKENSENKILFEVLKNIKKGSSINNNNFSIKEGETTPPKRYNSGSMILAMENAGQLIEDEALREQIKGSGIGTSATRAEILKKLTNIKYISLDKKTQIISPTLMGEMIFDVVNCSMKQLLNPELTASWEKGLTYVAEGTITNEEYMTKLEGFVQRRVDGVKIINNQNSLKMYFDNVSVFYKRTKKG